VPARDHVALAEAIDSLINDEKMIKKFSKAGLARIEKLFNWESAVEQMVELYSRLRR
jgi:glycosyltransferase involved in cell wall biosynthesis